MKLICKILLILFVPFKSMAQSEAKSYLDFNVGLSLELNYSGYNSIAAIAANTNHHILAIGPSYNISDGYLNKPVIGLAISYGFIAVQNKRVMNAFGFDYRFQSPLQAVQFHQLSYSSLTSVKLNQKIGMNTRVGYGIIKERFKLNGINSDSHHLGGFIQIGCAYSI